MDSPAQRLPLTVLAGALELALFMGIMAAVFVARVSPALKVAIFVVAFTAYTIAFAWVVERLWNDAAVPLMPRTLAPMTSLWQPIGLALLLYLLVHRGGSHVVNTMRTAHR